MKDPIKVLAVDDEDYMLKVLKACMPSPDFNITTCSDVMSAMSVFKRGLFDIVLLDVVMPGIDGFELHSLIRNINAEIPIIMLTAKIDDINGTMLNRISGDKNTYYQNKSFKREELVDRIKNIVFDIKAEKDKKDYFSEMEKDIALAGEVQRSMFPNWDTVAEGLRSTFYYRPYMKITGDVYCLQKISDGVFLFFIGDISGHGIQAALCMSAVEYELSQIIRNSKGKIISPDSILNALQTFMLGISSDRYMTCIASIIDFNKNKINFQNAGHPDLFIFDPDSQKFLDPNPEDKGSLPIGLEREFSYSPNDNVEMDFPPNAIFFGYTDGLTDLQDDVGNTYNVNPLEEFATTFASGGLTASTSFKIADALFKLGFEYIKDDIAIAAISRHIQKPNVYEYTMKPMLSEVDAFSSDFAKIVLEKTGNEVLSSKTEILLSEFLNNVVGHGLDNMNRSRPVISVKVEFNPSDIVITVCDKGKKWNMQNDLSDMDNVADILNYKRAARGRGLSMIRNISSSIRRSRYADILNETSFIIKK